MVLDQLRKELETLGVLDLMGKHPQLFEELLHPKPIPLTAECFKESLHFPQQPAEVDHQVMGMLIRFLDQSSKERLQSFVKFCIGGKDIRLIQGKKIAVEFHSQSFIQASTCSLQLPTRVLSYGLFEVALESSLQECGKAFTIP